MTYPRDYVCQDCGEHHYLDCSLPSEIWNRICEDRPGVLPGARGIGMPEVSMICARCVDHRLGLAGITDVTCEFYFVGTNLSSRLYGEEQ